MDDISLCHHARGDMMQLERDGTDVEIGTFLAGIAARVDSDSMPDP